MSQGVGAGPWPLQAPGSAASMTNFLPLDGKLVPRSLLSSLNTLRTFASIKGLLPRRQAGGIADTLWISDATRHGIINSNGSISVASFTSAFGLGITGVPEAGTLWQYATIYYAGDADDNVLVAAPGLNSYGTLTVTYFAGSALRTSYLTSAPRAQCVATFDNYVVAWNIEDVGSGEDYTTRVQWCQRGNPSNWTGEGSGFEDLLDMRGEGMRVVGTQDNRLILFTNQEIWYGLPATYPAQFQFYPLDRTVGVIGPATVVDFDRGLLFLGTDLNLRLLPYGGGASQIVAPAMREAIQSTVNIPTGLGGNASWAVFDPIQRLYYLYVDRSIENASAPFVFNVDTGEWGRLRYGAGTPYTGCTFTAPTNSAIKSSLFFGNSNGTVYSVNSALGTEDGSSTEASWQSPPLAADLHDCYKTLTNIGVAYRSFSTATLTLSIATTGYDVNAFNATTGTDIALARAPMHGRAEAQVYRGGAMPAIRLTSTSTGYELHRLDVQMVIGGRP